MANIILLLMALFLSWCCGAMQGATKDKTWESSDWWANLFGILLVLLCCLPIVLALVK